MATALKIAIKSDPDEFSPVPRLINCEAYDAGSDAKSRFQIKSNHGLREFATLTNGGGIRGLLVLQNKLYVVSGQKFFSVDTAGSIEEIGGIPGNDRVYMEVNRRTDAQMMLVSNGLVYQYQSGNFSEFNDPDLPPPVSVHFLNGNFIFPIADGRIFASGLETTEIDALDFATAEANRDGLSSGIIKGRDALYFGPETVEIWSPDGGSEFPQSQIHVDNQGCLSGKSVAKHDDQIFWLNKYGAVVAMGKNTYASRRVSNKRLERDIQDEINKQSIEGFTYTNRSIGYYVISGTSFTWRLNLETGLWSELKSYGLSVWKGLYSASFGNKTIIGDRSTNKLYYADESYNQEGSDHLIWRADLPLTHAFPDQLELNQVFVDTFPGLGDGSTDPHNSNPQITVRPSFDGGFSWGAARIKSVGQKGQKNKQVVLNRFGTTAEDGFSLSFESSAATSCGISGVSADIQRVPA